MFKSKIISKLNPRKSEPKNYRGGLQAKLAQQETILALEDSQSASTGNLPPPPIPDTTTIGQHFNLEGDNIVIRTKGALAINGSVTAEIHCEHLTIGNTANISGNIAADEIDIHGHVQGTVNGAEVTLHPTARVDADINAQFLSIARGAKFDGKSQLVDDPAQVAPVLVSNEQDGDQPLSIATDDGFSTEITSTDTELTSHQREEPPHEIEPHDEQEIAAATSTTTEPLLPTTLEPSGPSTEGFASEIRPINGSSSS